MKKIISILLIISMICSAAVFAVCADDRVFKNTSDHKVRGALPVSEEVFWEHYVDLNDESVWRELHTMTGDANGDGQFNVKDVTVLMKYLAGSDIEIYSGNADANLDGIVNVKDVSSMMKNLSGWSSWRIFY